MNPDHFRDRRRAIAIAAGVLAVAAWAFVALTVAYATRLRPIADDYCHAAAAGLGPWDAIVFWFNSWIGDLVQVTFTSLLVGQPLVHAPWSVASLIPFLATALVVAVASGFIVMQTARGTRRSAVVAWLTFAPVVLLCWWGFWWVPVAFQGGATWGPWELAAAITNWQTVNVQYVLVPALALIAWLAWDARTRGPRWVRVLGFALLGLIVGLCGLVFGATALVFIGLLWLVRSFLERRLDLVRGIETAAFAAFCVIGLLIAYFAPGSRRRVGQLEAAGPLPGHSPRALIEWIFPTGITNWIGDVFNVGTLVVAIVALGSAILLRLLDVRLDARRLALTGLTLLAFSLLLSVVSRAADAFAYDSFWHDVLPSTFVFLAAIALGASIGSALDRPGDRLRLVIIGVATTTALVLVAGGVLSMQHHISDRLVQWSAGPAPAATADIETDWVDECWVDFGEFRELPDRSK